MAQRHMMFEEAVMRFAGVTEIPTFDNPHPVKDATKPKGLGEACGGKKIDGCQVWLQRHAPKREVGDQQIQMVMTMQDVADRMCWNCPEGKRRG